MQMIIFSIFYGCALIFALKYIFIKFFILGSSYNGGVSYVINADVVGDKFEYIIDYINSSCYCIFGRPLPSITVITSDAQTLQILLVLKEKYSNIKIVTTLNQE